MRLVSLILPLCLLASCEKEEPSTVRVPSSLRLDHFELPVAFFSKDQLSSADSGYIEALVDGDLTEIHHPNGFSASTAGGQSFDEVLEGISRSVPHQGTIPPLLISATASTKFGTIRSVIRTAATAGIYRILFLVKSDSRGTGIIRFEVPTMGDELPDIEPFFIQIDDKGEIFTGTGPGRTRIDGGADDRDLEKLNDVLKLFAAAAKSAGSENAPCQIYVNPEASYQRMIDLLSMMKKWGLKPYFTDMEHEPRPKPILQAPRKPSAPYRMQPLPLAPPK
jgi:biopolymer transport protein ExbD